MEKEQPKSAAHIQEKEKKDNLEKEENVPKKERVPKNVKREKEKGSKISSQKRKSNSITNEKSVSNPKKRRKNTHSQSVSKVTEQNTRGKVDRNKFKTINGCSNSKWKRKKTSVIEKTTHQEKEADHIDNGSSKDDYWYSKLDQLAQNIYIPDPDDRIAHKKAKKIKRGTVAVNDNDVVKKDMMKLNKMPFGHSNGFDESRLIGHNYQMGKDKSGLVAHSNGFVKSELEGNNNGFDKSELEGNNNGFDKSELEGNNNGFDKSELVGSSGEIGNSKLTHDNEEIPFVPPSSPKHLNSYDPNLSHDACDTPPPTTSKIQNGEEEEKSSPTFTDSFESVTRLGQSICSEEEDDDLPEFLTNSEEQGYTPKEGDLIWYKCRTYPFWPAKIVKVSKMKTKVRLKIFFFGDAEKYSVNYSKRSVLPYFHPNKDVFTERGNEIDNKNLKKSFLKAIKDVTLEVMKKASVPLNGTPTEKQSFELNSSGEERLNSITSAKAKEEQSEFKFNWKQRGQLSFDSKITDKMLNQCKKRKERLQERNKILVDFIKTDKVKEYLFGVYRGQIESESHQKFHASATEQNHLRFKARSFWYLEDEEQITEVFEVLKDYYKEVSGCEINNIDYIVDVWFPEAVVYSLMKKKKLTKVKAWERFEKPKKRSKVEEILEHQQLLRSTAVESNMLKLRPPPKIKMRQTT